MQDNQKSGRFGAQKGGSKVKGGGSAVSSGPRSFLSQIHRALHTRVSDAMLDRSMIAPYTSFFHFFFKTSGFIRA